MNSRICVLLAVLLLVPGCDKDKAASTAPATTEKAPTADKTPAADKAAEKTSDNAAAAKPADDKAAAPDADSAAQVATVQAGFAAVNAGRFDDALTNWADDTTWYSAGLPGQPLQGKVAVKAFWEGLWKSFPDMKVMPTRIIANPDAIVVQAVIGGTDSGGVNGAPPSGKRVGLDALYVFRMKDGRIGSVNGYVNSQAMLTQIGQMPGPVAALAELPTGPAEVVAGALADPVARSIRDSIAAWNRGDAAASVAAQADDYVGHNHMAGKTVRGKAEALARAQGLMTAFPGNQTAEPRIAGAGSWGVLEFVAKGTHTGPMGDMPPTGKDVALHMGQLMRFEGGKIVESHVYGNGLELMTQLGLMGGEVAAAPADAPGAAPAVAPVAAAVADDEADDEGDEEEEPAGEEEEELEEETE